MAQNQSSKLLGYKLLLSKRCTFKICYAQGLQCPKGRSQNVLKKVLDLFSEICKKNKKQKKKLYKYQQQLPKVKGRH